MTLVTQVRINLVVMNGLAWYLVCLQVDVPSLVHNKFGRPQVEIEIERVIIDDGYPPTSWDMWRISNHHACSDHQK
jgi:hypothetical protein